MFCFCGGFLGTETAGKARAAQQDRKGFRPHLERAAPAARGQARPARGELALNSTPPCPAHPPTHLERAAPGARGQLGAVGGELAPHDRPLVPNLGALVYERLQRGHCVRVGWGEVGLMDAWMCEWGCVRRGTVKRVGVGWGLSSRGACWAQVC